VNESRKADPAVVRAAVVRGRLPNSMFEVELEGGERRTAHLAGDARAVLTRLSAGDQVLVETSRIDDGECRIVGRAPGTRGR
jgi:translation initiation factor IF-1